MVDRKGGDGIAFFDANIASFVNSYRDGGVMQRDNVGNDIVGMGSDGVLKTL